MILNDDSKGIRGIAFDGNKYNHSFSLKNSATQGEHTG
jgi:hypothetical protein